MWEVRAEGHMCAVYCKSTSTVSFYKNGNRQYFRCERHQPDKQIVEFQGIPAEVLVKALMLLEAMKCTPNGT